LPENIAANCAAPLLLVLVNKPLQIVNSSCSGFPVSGVI